ncbi:MAG: bifunctional metallophosphatase/5'-nucleotidase [Piscinibacter sp.]|uniref:bifunctional metallophosphatase/5'-nucleotidase n=1 Tax=Piscinibacter TaxID=1114981 RepID=UPI000FDECF03|nr:MULTISPECIES: bifunctional metallophosphatase/5'-nucleotidase [Piscinibacter]MCW5667686.1 bifunctional metallophosphatase/5'-nucleotidase [Piscinibacter sp.]
MRFLLLAATLLAAGCSHVTAPPGPVPVRLIALNDFHGHLQPPGRFGVDNLVPAEQRPLVGGADAVAAKVAQLKQGQSNTAVVAAGDLVGASPLVSALFHDEPAVEALNRIGLEFSAVGNHEFDRGAAELLRLQRGGCRRLGDGRDASSCRGASAGTPVPFEGARFQWLAANVVQRADGATLLPPFGVKAFDGVPVAFIGMTLQATPSIVTPRGVAGLEFRDEADTVAALVPALRARGIEAIVVLLHEGGVQSGARAALNACEGLLAGSPLARIVARLDDAVDLVISGHTHAAYNCRLPNAAGRPVPVTSASAFGRVLTRIDLQLDPLTRDVRAVQAENQLVERPADGLQAAAPVRTLVEAYAALAAPLAQRVVGSIAADVPAQAVDAACNMPAGELIADAQLAATAAPSLGGAEAALMNRGGVRQPGFVHAGSPAGEGDGRVTWGELFTVQPFGNSLVTQTFSAAQLRELLEQQFAGCRGQQPGATRLLIPSAGLHYTWDGARPCGERIRELRLRGEPLVADGRVTDPQRRVRLTVNSFLAGGGDGFGVLTEGRDALGGAQDIDALAEHLARFQPPQPPYDPRAQNPAGPRIRRAGGGTACPTGADTNP